MRLVDHLHGLFGFAIGITLEENLSVRNLPRNLKLAKYLAGKRLADGCVASVGDIDLNQSAPFVLILVLNSWRDSSSSAINPTGSGTRRTTSRRSDLTSSSAAVAK